MSKVTRLAAGEGGEARRGQLHLREVPAETDLSYESVGQVLRAARLARGDEMGNAARALRIRKDYLEAIESDDPEKLPGRTYAIGFVRSYSEYLGLDTPELVARYKAQTAGQTDAQPQVGPPPELSAQGFGFVQVIVAIGILALGIYGLYRLSLPPVRQSLGSSTTIATRSAGNSTVPRSPSSQVKGRIAAVKPAAANAATTAAQFPPGMDSGQVFGAQNAKARVVLHALAVTHVLVQGSGGKIFINRLLHPGDAYRVPDLAGLSLTTPDGGAVSLEVDGQDRGAAGPAGHLTKGLSLEPRAIADRRGDGNAYGNNKVTP